MLKTTKFLSSYDWLHRVYNWAGNRLPSILPHHCILCGGELLEEQYLCDGCRSDLPYQKTCCVQCGISLSKNTVCGKCQKTSPYYDRSIIPFSYQFPIDWMVKSLKFKQQLYLAKVAGLLISDYVASHHVTLPEVLVPVPLHRYRQLVRGYNQSLEISRVIGSELQLSVEHSLCQRTRNTPPQARLSASDRKRNIDQAFKVKKSIGYKHIALVDDVVTTGSTVDEMAMVFRNRGVERVDVWALAHAGH